MFGNEPTIMLGFAEKDEIREAGEGVAGVFKVTVTVKDGENVVAVDAEKVAALFECTGDLADWTGEAALVPVVETKGAEGDVLRFEVTPGDGTVSRAFLRIGE